MAKEEIICQDFEAQIPAEEKGSNLWQRMRLKMKIIIAKRRLTFGWKRKSILIVAGIVILLTLIIVVASSSYRVSQFKPPTFPTPSPSPLEEEIANPSAYATDSAILEIEKRLREIEQDLDETDLKETGLNPPVLDMKVEFKE